MSNKLLHFSFNPGVQMKFKQYQYLMKYIFLLLLIFQAICQSSNTSPHSASQQVAVSAKSPDFAIIEYFSFDSIKANLPKQQWYAFLSIKAQQNIFWIRFRVYLSTVEKFSGKESGEKVECFTNHNDLHDCYISSKAIDTNKQNLRVQMVFEEETDMQIKLQINSVYNLKPGEQVTLQKEMKNFTRLLRMDVRQLKDFYFVLLELTESFIVDQYKNAMTFIGSLQQTPPDMYRYYLQSFPFWDNRQLAALDFQQLKQIEYITILIGITDQNTYKFRSRLITNTSEVQKIEPNQQYLQAARQKSYKIELPNRQNTSYYLLRITIDSYFYFQATNIKLNGKNISKIQLQQFLAHSGSFSDNKQIDVWLNSTVQSLEFTFSFIEGGIYKIYLSQFNINLIDLPQKLLWGDELAINQTQYLYIVIDTKTSGQTINLDVLFKANRISQSIKFRNCVQKTVEQCQSIAMSTNQTKRLIGMPIISPMKQYRIQVVIFTFNNLTITKHQLQPYLYRSIIVVQITAQQLFRYYLQWRINNPVQIIKPNQLIQRKIQADEYLVFCFTVINATNIAFARVHFLAGNVGTNIFGYDQLLSINSKPNSDNQKHIIFQFDGSVTFTQLQSKKTYYIYVKSGRTKDIFQMTLTYGYSTDDDKVHPVSYLTIGQHSKNQLVLAPFQILFVQIRSDHIGLLSIQNNHPVKICRFYQIWVPQSHQDMKKSSYCQNYSTFNYFYTYKVQNSNKSYLGIQNQNSYPVSISLVTENDQLNCPHSLMGQTKFLLIDNSKNKNETIQNQCVIYALSQKGEIQIFVDLNNPKLQGIAQPEISIGQKYTAIMTTNLLLISQQNVDNYCKQNYQHCLLTVRINRDENHQIYQQFIPISASYTNQPLVLKDGLAHHSHIKPNQVKHFKYSIYSNKDISTTVKFENFIKNNISVYAKIITAQQKFIYPKMEDYQSNQSTPFTYAAILNSYFYPILIKIPKQDLYKKCMANIGCYVLFSVYSIGASQQSQQKFLIQATQTINTLSSGSRMQKYIEKDSKAYFNFKNSQAKSLLFFTTSNVKDCLKIDVYLGNNGAESKHALASGIQEVLVEKAQKSWYTVSVQAQESCFFTIQVSSSNIALRQLTFGYANQFSLNAAQKIYYIIHNSNEQILKLVTSLSQQKSGQLILRAMPVTDNQVGDFIKFINGQELSKRSKLEFVWIDINHLTLRKEDSKFCIDCYICIEAEASKQIKGYLTIPSHSDYSLYLREYISYDILLKGQSFSWLTSYSQKSQVYIAIQAGELEIIVTDALDQQKKKQTLKFNKVTPQKNLIKIDYEKQSFSQLIHIKVKVVALENSDYSIYSKESKHDQYSRFIQVGRPNYFYAIADREQCFKGQSNDQQNQFVISLSKQDNTLDISSKLMIFGKINGKNITFHKEVTPNNILLSFYNQLQDKDKGFQICIKNIGDTTVAGTLAYLGNLNYFPQNSVIHIKKAMNLTFMSEGKGVIQIDECASRGTVISLNKNYKDAKKVNSKINSKRVANNLIQFQHVGSVYMHADTTDYVALRWKNIHKSSKNGNGYELYSPSTFRISYDQNTKDLSIKVSILQKKTQSKDLPQILMIDYHVYVSGEQLDLYKAMNCQKGKYMHWVHTVEDQEAINKQALVKLNNVADLKSLFKTKQYVLIIVKAEVQMKWPNNFTESYRFYYPYQQLLLSQFHDQLTKQDDKIDKKQSTNSNFILFLVIAIVVVGALTFVAIKFIKKNIWRTSFFIEQDANGTELQTKVQSQSSVMK